MKRKFIIIILLAIFLLIAVIYFSLDEDEVFELQKLEYTVFKVVSHDTLNECYSITTNLASIGNSDKFLIGVRMKIKRLSRKHEGFSVFLDKEGSEHGHSDTISSVNFTDSNGMSLMKYVQPSSLSFVRTGDNVITNHTLSNANNCYTSKAGFSATALKDWYNSLTWADPNITNYFFFKIDPGMVAVFKSQKTSIVFAFKDQKLLKGYHTQ